MDLNLIELIKSRYVNKIDNETIRVKYVPDNRGSPRIGKTQWFNSSINRKEMTLEYEILFEDGFEWVKGGKLPGFGGGSQRIRTTGCVQPQPKNAWSFRLMWGRDGSVKLYIYDQSRNPNNIRCGVVTTSKAGVLKTGQWMTFQIYAKLNSKAGAADGEAKLFIDGEEVLSRDNIEFRGINNGARIDYFMFSTFYGGSDRTWAPSKPTYIQFRNCKVYDGLPNCDDCSENDVDEKQLTFNLADIQSIHIQSGALEITRKHN